MSGKLQVNLLRLSGTASANKNFERSPYKVLQSRKAVLLRQNLKRHHFQLVFQLQNMICKMLTCCEHTECVIEASLKLCGLLNETILFVTTKNIHRMGGAQICSNTFPAIMALPKKIDIGIILQVNLRTNLGFFQSNPMDNLFPISARLQTAQRTLLPSADHLLDSWLQSRDDGPQSGVGHL